MKLNIEREVAALEQMTVGQFQQRYVELFSEPGTSSTPELKPAA